MQVTPGWMSSKYSEFNKKYFNGNLPDASRVAFSVNNKKAPMGTAYYTFNTRTLEIIRYAIALSNFYDTTEHGKEAVLIHEMCHISHYHNRLMDFLKRDRYGRFTIDRSFDAHTGFFLDEAARINSMSDYNVSRYYPSDSSNEAENDQLYRLSDVAERKFNKEVCFCIFKRKGEEKLAYFFCDHEKRLAFDEIYSHNGVEKEWFTTQYKNVHQLKKSVKRVNAYSRTNPNENTMKFLVNHFKLTPLESSLNEMINNAVKQAISEFGSSNTPSVEASSTPFVREEGDIIIYGVE